MIPEKKDLENWFHITGNDRLWIAGSTHPGEELILWQVFQQMRRKVPDLKLVLAPRDPARSRQVAREIAQNGGIGIASRLEISRRMRR